MVGHSVQAQQLQQVARSGLMRSRRTGDTPAAEKLTMTDLAELLECAKNAHSCAEDATNHGHNPCQRLVGRTPEELRGQGGDGTVHQRV